MKESVSVSDKELHSSYVRDLSELFEKQGFKVILEGHITRLAGEWAEPDIFVLKKDGTRLWLEKIVEVIIGDSKEGKVPNSLLNKCRKIRDYYNPPEIIVFEPTGYTNNRYDPLKESKGRFSSHEDYNEYLHKQWNKEGLHVTFWNEWSLEEQQKAIQKMMREL